MIKVSELKNNPSNPRSIKKEQFEKLKRSIETFPEMMEKRPMVCVTDVDGKLFPLGGNMRLRAIRVLGYKEIPKTWVILADDWSEEKRKEFAIKDNASMGDWDWDMLSNEWDIDKLKEWGINTSYEDMTEKDVDSVYNDSNCLYPLIPIYDEKYTAYIIICESETEEAAVRTKFNFPDKARGYKNKFLGKSNVLKASEIL